MKFGICPLSVVPIRAAASDNSELCTQLLFGETFEVLEAKGKRWLKVRCQADNYVGWVRRHQVCPITPSEFQRFKTQFAYCLDLVQNITSNHQTVPITFGARLSDFDGKHFRLEDQTLAFSGQAVAPNTLPVNSQSIRHLAAMFLQAPALAGGRSPFGIDSAGLVQLSYQIIGIMLPREAQQQVMFGDLIDFIEEAQEGDLAFFERKNGKVHHVGIIFPDQHILHVDGCVRLDRLDHYGIYQTTSGQYSHRLRVIRRILKSTIEKPTRMVQENIGEFVTL